MSIYEMHLGSWMRVPEENYRWLTYREIASKLFLSPHTVKSQAVAIYGKLGVASRRAAIERAVEAGLLERSVLRFPSGTSGSGLG